MQIIRSHHHVFIFSGLERANERSSFSRTSAEKSSGLFPWVFFLSIISGMHHTSGITHAKKIILKFLGLIVNEPLAESCRAGMIEKALKCLLTKFDVFFLLFNWGLTNYK